MINKYFISGPAFYSSKLQDPLDYGGPEVVVLHINIISATATRFFLLHRIFSQL